MDQNTTTPPAFLFDIFSDGGKAMTHVPMSIPPVLVYVQLNMECKFTRDKEINQESPSWDGARVGDL